MKKLKVEPLSPIKFGSLTLYRPNPVIMTFDDWYAYQTAIEKQGNGRNRIWRYSIDADTMHVRNNGNMVVSCNESGFSGSMKVTDSAFQQLLHILRIPLNFAQRMPSDILVSLINRYLEKSYTKRIAFRCTPDMDVIIGFTEYSERIEDALHEDRSYATASGFIGHISREFGTGQYPSKIVCDQDVTRAIFSIDSRTAEKLGIKLPVSKLRPIIEVVFSDGGNFLPHVCLGQQISFATQEGIGSAISLSKHKRKIDSLLPDQAIKAMNDLVTKIVELPIDIDVGATIPLVTINNLLKVLNSKHTKWVADVKRSDGSVPLIAMIPRLAMISNTSKSVLQQRKISFVLGSIIQLINK